MATFRNVGTIGKFEDKLIGNMTRRGFEAVLANRDRSRVASCCRSNLSSKFSDGADIAERRHGPA